jgi:hypothetical protein
MSSRALCTNYVQSVSKKHFSLFFFFLFEQIAYTIIKFVKSLKAYMMKVRDKTLHFLSQKDLT